MTKLPEEIRSMHQDAFKIHETLTDMGNTPEEWTKACELFKEVSLKHNNHPFIMGLLEAVLAQLERDRRCDADGS